MANSQLGRPGQSVAEINGRPGQVWGSVVIPASGKATMRIQGDTLYTITTTSYGLEKKEIQTRIQNIDSVEIVEGRLWWLLFLGIITLRWYIGVIPIVLFFILKQNWVVIHTPCSHLILFYKKSENAQGFCSTLLNLSRQLNSPAIPRQQNSAQASRPNNVRPTSTVS